MAMLNIKTVLTQAVLQCYDACRRLHYSVVVERCNLLQLAYIQLSLAWWEDILQQAS